MNLAEDYVKFVVRYVLSECAEDIKFFNDFVDEDKVVLMCAYGFSLCPRCLPGNCTFVVLFLALASCFSVV